MMAQEDVRTIDVTGKGVCSEGEGEHRWKMKVSGEVAQGEMRGRRYSGSNVSAPVAVSESDSVVSLSMLTTLGSDATILRLRLRK